MNLEMGCESGRGYLAEGGKRMQRSLKRVEILFVDGNMVFWDVRRVRRLWRGKLRDSQKKELALDKPNLWRMGWEDFVHDGWLWAEKKGAVAATMLGSVCWVAARLGL